ncbi:MAG: helix-turn-helix transcriptional regulator [Oscillospiraceae bacterium]|nr:helix-turn-helix transcriptional regulator [Oscillospiraceae bacterium]
MQNFPVMLRSLRKQAKMTQPELAEKLGISRSAVSMYESGSREPNFAMLEAIADIFNVDMNTLTGSAPVDRPLGDREIKFALFGTYDVDDALLEEVKAFAQFAKQRRK